MCTFLNTYTFLPPSLFPPSLFPPYLPLAPPSFLNVGADRSCLKGLFTKARATWDSSVLPAALSILTFLF